MYFFCSECCWSCLIRSRRFFFFWFIRCSSRRLRFSPLCFSVCENFRYDILNATIRKRCFERFVVKQYWNRSVTEGVFIWPLYTCDCYWMDYEFENWIIAVGFSRVVISALFSGWWENVASSMQLMTTQKYNNWPTDLDFFIILYRISL